jgi:osmotically-inducible protein OsmY
LSISSTNHQSNTKEIEMTNLKALGLLLALGASLSGCATFNKCGFDGCPGDAKTTANVEALLDQREELGAPNSISVQTLDHVVYLQGFVSEGLQSRTAESLAREAPGVEQVVNEIAVTR